MVNVFITHLMSPYYNSYTIYLYTYHTCTLTRTLPVYICSVDIHYKCLWRVSRCVSCGYDMNHVICVV